MSIAIDIVVRGNVVEWTSKFFDANGVQLDPLSATVTINYPSGGTARAHVTVAMEKDTEGYWLATWDSSPANPGRVYWCIWANDSPAVEDGFFELRANKANLNVCLSKLPG